MKIVKRLLIAVAAALLIAAPVSAAGGTMLISGTYSFHRQLDVLATTTAAGDLTITATYAPKPNVLYKVRLENVDDFAVMCNSVATGTSPATCTIVGAPAGTYRVQFWPITSQAIASVVVSGALGE